VTAAAGVLPDVVVSGDAEGVTAKRAPAVKIAKRAKMEIPRFINIPFDEDDESSSIRSESTAHQSSRIKNLPVG
jgi:hypothetical protein